MNPVSTIIAVRTVQASALALALHGLLHWPLTGPRALGIFLCPLLCLYFVFVFVAPWSWGLPILTRLATREKAVALTFDDGPSGEITPRVLDILARHGAQATFFVLGENVRRHPEMLRRIVAEGHRVGLHGDTHVPFVLHSGRRVREEIAHARAAIGGACPDMAEPAWLRPPHGFKNLALPLRARRSGCRLVSWNLNPRDYRAADAGAIMRVVLSRLRPGAIILLHDGAVNAATADALPQILDGLTAAGYGCATL